MHSASARQDACMSRLTKSTELAGKAGYYRLSIGSEPHGPGHAAAEGTGLGKGQFDDHAKVRLRRLTRER